MLRPAVPGMAVWPAAMIVWGRGFRSEAHRHHCVQLVMTLRGDMRVRGGPEQRWMKCGAALVRPDAVHEMDASEKRSSSGSSTRRATSASHSASASSVTLPVCLPMRSGAGAPCLGLRLTMRAPNDG